MVFIDKIFKTFSWIILMNGTLEHDMKPFPTFPNKCNRHALIFKLCKLTVIAYTVKTCD